ncbi:AI-2E family transporter [Patescibacteria group bacterium]|nr:AI-2E family transporter [Patescibacteria group bacterium]MDE2021507.1 AI-2E family transporter [Patescibacteria group bacterium]MDE2173099.1 AI-2E family transporter [Patescibacteria group bacterium]
MDKEVRISITSGTIVTALLIIAGAYIFWLLRDISLLVLTAIVIASAIEPGVAFFIRHGIPRFAAAVLVYVLVFGSVFSLFYFFFPPIVGDAANFLSSAPHYLDTLNISTPFSNIANVTSLASGQRGTQSFAQTLLSLQSVFAASSGGVLQLFITFFGGIFSLVLVIVLSFYFALQDTGVDDFLRLVIPAAHEEYAVDLWKRAQKKIGLWMQGQILLSVIVGILVYLGLLIIAIPYALLLAVFTAFAEIIPIFGSLVAGTMAVIVGYASGGVALGAIVAGLYIVVNQFESNLIYPLIVKKIIGIPPLLVIVALIAGYTLAGFLGVLLSVPVAAVLLELLTDFDKHKRRIEHRST